MTRIVHESIEQAVFGCHLGDQRFRGFASIEDVWSLSSTKILLWGRPRNLVKSYKACGARVSTFGVERYRLIRAPHAFYQVEASAHTVRWLTSTGAPAVKRATPRLSARCG